VLSANLGEIPRWKENLPITAPDGIGVNLESTWTKLYPGMAFSAIQQGQLGTCVPMAVSHCMFISALNQSPLAANYGQAIAEWIYWVARYGMPTDEQVSPQGCAFYNAVRAMQYIGAPCYGVKTGITAYDWNRGLLWGSVGPGDYFLKYQRIGATMVRRICSPEEFVSAINAGHAIAQYGNWSFFNNDQKGIITGPSVSPSSIPKGASPLSMWGHAMSGIGYKVINGEVFGGFRNHSATKNHTGGQDPLFPFRGTGLMSLNDPIIKTVFSKYNMVSIGGIAPYTPKELK
jgi:hypothetical protein